MYKRMNKEREKILNNQVYVVCIPPLQNVSVWNVHSAKNTKKIEGLMNSFVFEVLWN